MANAREDAAAEAVGPGERSVVRSLRGLRWWAALALAAVLTLAGVGIDLVSSGELGVVFTAFFAGGCILATAWARRDSLFVPLVQPPLLLAVAVPVVVVASGSLPRSGGTAAALLAVGGPLVNGFPTLAITTAICLALGFVRTRLEPYQRPEDQLDPDRARPPRDARGRDPRDRGERPRRDGAPRERGPRDSRDSRDPRDRRRVPIEVRSARDDRRRRPLRPEDPDDFGPGVRRVPRRADGPDDRR